MQLKPFVKNVYNRYNRVIETKCLETGWSYIITLKINWIFETTHRLYEKI